MRLVLVRHAESDAGQRGIIAGAVSCTGLTAHGCSQAHALARRFETTGELGDCQTLLASPFMRAKQTAELLSGALPAGQIREYAELCELQPGDADGLTTEQVLEKYGTFDMLEYPDRPFSPNGESWNAFVDRVSRCLQSLSERYRGETVVAVTHSGFIVASIITTFEIPRPGTGARLDPLHTSLTEWRVTDNIWQLVRYNDAHHL
jgi:broad specificity phosphatase PhoE